MVYFDIKPGAVKITRYDQKRTIMVLGDIDEEVISLDRVNARIAGFFEPLEQRFPGVNFQIGGQFEAGFVITGFYEDRCPPQDNDLLSKYLATFIATRALKKQNI